MPSGDGVRVSLGCAVNKTASLQRGGEVGVAGFHQHGTIVEVHNRDALDASQLACFIGSIRFSLEVHVDVVDPKVGE